MAASPSNQYRRPILVTGSHRSGSTWVGKMIDASGQTYYAGEIFNPQDRRLPDGLIRYWFQYIPPEDSQAFRGPLQEILDLNFSWGRRGGLRRYLPSRLALLRYTRRWFGIPRPLLKDPIAAMSAEWLAETFDMDVICLVRHPAAFVTSLQKANWKGGVNQLLRQPALMRDWLSPYAEQMASPPADPVERGALLWLALYHVLTCYAGRHPDWMVWRLEDISADPVAAFEQIYARLGLRYSQRARRRVWETSNERNSGEPPPQSLHAIRRNSRAAQGKWRRVLTPAQIDSIRRITEPVSQHYYSDQDW